MPLRALTRFPGAAAAVLSVDDRAREVVFAAEPRPGARSPWFRFRIADPQPPAGTPPPPVRVRLAFADALPGCDAAGAALLRPVYREKGNNWIRAKPGSAAPGASPAEPPSVVWDLPAPPREGALEVALDVPYGADDLAATVRRSNGFWTETAAGLLPGGQVVRRLSSGQPPTAAPRALYVAARRDPAAAPAAWALDGLLEAFSRAKSAKWRVWAVPAADPPAPAAEIAPALRAFHETDFARCAAGARPELFLELDAAPPGGCVRAAAAPAADPASDKAARTWIRVFAQALAPEWADAASFDAGDADAASLPAVAVPRVAVRIPVGRVRTSFLAPRQYRELGQRLAKAVLARW